MTGTWPSARPRRRLPRSVTVTIPSRWQVTVPSQVTTRHDDSCTSSTGSGGSEAVPSDSCLNISQRSCWVVCPLGRTRGHGLYTPGGFKNTEKKIPCSNGRFPAAWLLGPQREEQRDLFIFCLLCSPYSVRRSISILSYAPDHVAFSPRRFLTATTLPRRSTQVCYIYLHSSLIRHILLDMSETLTPSNSRYPCAIHSTTAKVGYSNS